MCTHTLHKLSLCIDLAVLLCFDVVFVVFVLQHGSGGQNSAPGDIHHWIYRV